MGEFSPRLFKFKLLGLGGFRRWICLFDGGVFHAASMTRGPGFYARHCDRGPARGHCRGGGRASRAESESFAKFPSIKSPNFALASTE